MPAASLTVSVPTSLLYLCMIRFDISPSTVTHPIPHLTTHALSLSLPLSHTRTQSLSHSLLFSHLHLHFTLTTHFHRSASHSYTSSTACPALSWWKQNHLVEIFYRQGWCFSSLTIPSDHWLCQHTIPNWIYLLYSTGPNQHLTLSPEKPITSSGCHLAWTRTWIVTPQSWHMQSNLPTLAAIHRAVCLFTWDWRLDWQYNVTIHIVELFGALGLRSPFCSVRA